MKRSFNLIRLAAVPLSLTLISILAGSVINRVMVVELGLPVTLAGLFLAVPLLVAPIRVWLVNKISPAPNDSTCLTHSIASLPVGVRPP